MTTPIFLTSAGPQAERRPHLNDPESVCHRLSARTEMPAASSLNLAIRNPTRFAIAAVIRRWQ